MTGRQSSPTRRRAGTLALIVTMVAAVFSLAPLSSAGAAGAPSQLAFVVQPAGGSRVAPNAVAVSVAVQDSHGNVISDDNTTAITLAIASGPSGGVLTCAGGATHSASSGVAAFNCTVNTLGTYSLHATSVPVYTAATSNSFDVTQYLQFTNLPIATTVSEVAFTHQPVIALKDLGGATLTGDSTTVVTLAIAAGPAGATLACTGGLTKQVTAGVATFAGCNIDKVGTYTLAATASAFASATSTAFDITPGLAHHVAYLTQPANGSLTSPAVTFIVAIEDHAGNVTTGDSTSTLTLSIATGPGGATLACTGTNTQTVSSGATLFQCTLDTAGDYTITATPNPVGPPVAATSNSFTVTQYAAFTVEPGSGTGGSPIITQPIVTLYDATGAALSGDNATVVTLAIAAGPTGATLSCTNGLTRTVSAGVAGFTGCKIDKAGTYRLSASAPGFATAMSADVVIAVGPPARLVFSVQPGNGSAGVPFAPQPQVTVQDLGGNTVVSDTNSITLGILGGTGTANAQIHCPPDATVAGIVDFDGCTVDRAGTGYRLVAFDKADKLSATSTAFDVTFVAPFRVFGSDAVATAILISSSEYATDGSANAVVLARSDFYSDALAGGPLAVANHAPLLITPGAPESGVIDPRVLTEIQRVLPAGNTVYVLGGPLALAPSIDGTLQSLGYNVVRVAGKTMYGTATAIADELGNPATIFEATGLDFADALSAVPAAVMAHGAILLTNGTVQAPETAVYLAEHPASSRFAIGGPLAAAGADPGATAVYGEDLYETSAAVATTFFPRASTFGAATGASYSDALAGGVFMSVPEHFGPMLLVAPAVPLPASIEQYLHDDVWGTRGYVFGGPLAVSDAVVQAITTAISS